MNQILYILQLPKIRKQYQMNKMKKSPKRQWRINTTQHIVYEQLNKLELLTDTHIKYCTKRLLNSGYSIFYLDVGQLWCIYWPLNALSILQDDVSKYENQIIQYLETFKIGGFTGGPIQLEHLAPTFSSLLSLFILSTPAALELIDRQGLKEFFWSVQDQAEKGSYLMHINGEADIRAVYIVVIMVFILKLDPKLLEGCAEYIASCQTYEGGIDFCQINNLIILSISLFDTQHIFLIKKNHRFKQQICLHIHQNNIYFIYQQIKINPKYMLNKLQQELDELNKKQKQTQTRINKLFYSVEDVYIRQHSINHPILPNPNLICKIRPEIINQIFDFLDYSSFLQFRLVSQNTNNQILYLLSLKLHKKEQLLQNNQIEQKEIISSHPELNQELESLCVEFNKSLEDIKKIRRQDICELASFRIPPAILEKVLKYLTILLTENYVEQQYNWHLSMRLITNCNFLNQLLNFDILLVPDDKLKLIQDIITLEEKMVYSSSLFSYYIYKYIRTIVILRQQPQYKLIFQVSQMRLEETKLKQSIEKLQKIIK
ncbi:unnamed protein product [Paramecium octaurelia]|uniref:F-box domain-containing protein n=1 Tax=Paramecium octaurelia TaxID=43137 RepID=A0A8S1X1E7_PAROT|nr:unnamed protein product [Paramecium octaurelia]